jgi:hypothetical protein
MSLSNISAEDLLEIISLFGNPGNPIIRLKARVNQYTVQTIIISNKGDKEMAEEIDWLDGCIPFTGVGADQTTGVIGLPEGIFVEDLVKTVIVFDDNTEDGLVEIKKTDLKAGMKIANIKFWEARIPADVLVVDAIGNSMSREAWFHSISPITGEERQTDGLAIWAAKKLRMKSNGGGIHF